MTLQIQMLMIIYREIKLEETEILRKIFKLRVSCREKDGQITFEKSPNGWSDEMDYKNN